MNLRDEDSADFEIINLTRQTNTERERESYTSMK